MASNPTPAAPAAPPTGNAPGSSGFSVDYTQYQNPSVSVTFLDNAANAFVAAAGGNFVSKIWAGIVLVVACAYIWGRDKLITQQMLIQKQQYELAQTQGEGGEVNNQTPPSSTATPNGLTAALPVPATSADLAALAEQAAGADLATLAQQAATASAHALLKAAQTPPPSG
jgi:hypothetical protein